MNLDHDEPDGLTEDTPEDLDDEGFEEILSCYDDSTVTAPCLEMAFPSREQGEQESQKEPMPVYGKYTTKWNNNNNTITYGSIFIFQELITFGHFISFLFSSLRHVKWAEQWAFGCRWQSNKQQLSANYVGQGRVMATWIIVHVQESN